MPALIILLFGLLITSRTVQATALILATMKIADWKLGDYKHKKLKHNLKLGINPIDLEEEVKIGFPIGLNHYRLTKEQLNHPSQVWAIGDFIWTSIEHLQAMEYMEVTASNVIVTGSKGTIIRGQKLFVYGRKRWEDPDFLRRS